MRKLLPGSWLLLAILSSSACTSDRAALESRGSTDQLTAETHRAKPPGVSAYSSVPGPAASGAAGKPAAAVVLLGKAAPKVAAAAPKSSAPKPRRPAARPPAPAKTAAAAPAPAPRAAPVRARARPQRAGRPPATLTDADIPAPVGLLGAPSAAPAPAVATRVTPKKKRFRRKTAPPGVLATAPVAALMFRPDSSVVRERAPWARLARATAPGTQVFTVNPRRDTVLQAAGGTLVRITAGAFALATDTTTAVPFAVELRLRELLTLPDLVLANITTRAATGHLLETAGALWVTATANGWPCVLRSGRDLHLALPVRGARRQAMRGFTADSTLIAPDGLRWHPIPGPEPLEVVRAMPPQYLPGLALLEKSIRERMGFSPALAQQLLDRMPLADRRALRKEWSESGRVLRYTKTLKQGLDVVSIPFDVAEDGTASNWGTATGYHSILFNALQEVAPTLPGAWRAGTCAARATAMHARLQVLCFDDGAIDVEIRSDPDDWTPCEDPARARLLVQASAPPAGIADAEVAALAARTRPLATDLLGSRYLLDAAKLGWVTCYRPTEAPGTKMTYSLPAGAPDAEVRLIFQKARVVVGGIMRGAQAEFTNVPAHELVTVVALRYTAQGQAHLALQPAIIGEPLAAPLLYKPVTVAELRAALAALEPAE